MEKQLSNIRIKQALLLIKRFWSNSSILFTLTLEKSALHPISFPSHENSVYKPKSKVLFENSLAI